MKIRNKWTQNHQTLNSKQIRLGFVYSNLDIISPTARRPGLIENFDIRISKLIFVALMLVMVLPMVVHAEAPRNVQVSPGVIDEKAKPRDIIKESLTLQNTSDRPLKLFPSVEDVNPENGDQNFGYAGNADARSDSLANWIELSRGMIELAPGETRTVPFVIRVNMNAVPGSYHVQINFTNGGTRDETENKNPDGYASVNVEVLSDAKEDLQLVKFSTDRLAFSGDDVLFNYQLQNIGNQDLQPTGDIRIYDRRGQEVATIDVNKDGKLVSPDQTAQLASAWSAVNGFGQFKALITVNYGKSQTASVQDTIFFWIVPWKQILGIFVGTLIALVVLALYFHQWFEERHLEKLALAGLLKTSPAQAAAVYIPPFSTPAVSPPRPVLKQPAVEVKAEPKERIVVRIAENIVIAWRLFTTFKQRGRLTPHDIAYERSLAQPKKSEQMHVASVVKEVAEPEQYADDGVYADYPEYPGAAQTRDEYSTANYGDSPSQPVHGEIIDLKVIRPQNKEVIHEGHTVNLKKRI